MAAIVVENFSDAPVEAFVSNYGEAGDDGWFLLNIGQAENWGRNNWQVVGFRNVADTQRAAIYVRPDAIVRFFAMDNIQVL